MQRMALALLALSAFASFFPVTDCSGLTGPECTRQAAIDAGIID